MMPEWTLDAGSLKAHGTAVVWADCNGVTANCDSRVIDLERVIARHGERFSFWNRHPRCPTPGCGGALQFRAVPGGGAWQVQMHGVPQLEADTLHERWKASLPSDVRDALPVVPMLQATGNFIVMRCAICELSPVYIGAAQAVGWRRMSIDEVTEHVARQCRAGGCGLALDMVPADQVPDADR